MALPQGRSSPSPRRSRRERGLGGGDARFFPHPDRHPVELAGGARRAARRRLAALSVRGAAGDPLPQGSGRGGAAGRPAGGGLVLLPRGLPSLLAPRLLRAPRGAGGGARADRASVSPRAAGGALGDYAAVLR